MAVRAEVPERRGRHGRRQPRAAIRGRAGAAMRCGDRSSSASAEWGRHSDATLVQALGFTPPPTPGAAMLFPVVRRRDRAALEARLGAWAAAVVATTAASDAPFPEAVALDGKTLRGSRRQGAPGAHLRSAVSHRRGLTLAQTGGDDHTHASTAAPTIRADVLRRGRGSTVAARLTHRALAQPILAGGGDAVLVVKAHHPEVHAAMARTVASPPPRRPTVGTGRDARGRARAVRGPAPACHDRSAWLPAVASGAADRPQRPPPGPAARGGGPGSGGRGRDQLVGGAGDGGAGAGGGALSLAQRASVAWGAGGDL